MAAFSADGGGDANVQMESEILQAIYNGPGEFTFDDDDTGAGGRVLTFKIGTAPPLTIKLLRDYPRASPPTVVTAGGAGGLEKARALARKLWEAAGRDVCLMQIVDTWSTMHGTQANIVAAAAAQASDPRIAQSLADAGFSACGGACHVHDEGITVELGGTVSVTVDSGDVSEADVSLFLELQQKRDPGEFGEALLEWVRAAKNGDAPGFGGGGGGDGGGDGGGGGGSGGGGDDADDSFACFLPGAEELGADPNRKLLIFTWGRKVMKWEAVRQKGAQQNFNASVLNGRGAGVDLRKMNGLDPEVQRCVGRCPRCPQWLALTVGAIEKKDLAVIAINCAKGRHRSVAAAELLRALYYPSANVQHLTIR